MKNIVKLIIGYLLILPASIYWISTVFGIDILERMEGRLTPEASELSSALILPLEILLMVFPLISGLLGISVYKKNDRFKIAGLLLMLLSIVIMIITILLSFETATFTEVLVFYIIGVILGIYIYKRKN